MGNRGLRIGFAGDRDVAVSVLAYLLSQGEQLITLILPDEGQASDDRALMRLCEDAGPSPHVYRARDLAAPTFADALRASKLDYLVSVHFPHILKPPVLDAVAGRVLNLHPAFLPYNRGWHTPTWAILEGTPAGASLHYVSDSLDSGEVVYQETIGIDPADTAHTLYLKIKALETRVFAEGWRRIRAGDGQLAAQSETCATLHRRRDLFDPAVQRIELDEVLRASDLLRRLRALTTSRVDEAAYFEVQGRRYRVQVTITPEGFV